MRIFPCFLVGMHNCTCRHTEGGGVACSAGSGTQNIAFKDEMSSVPYRQVHPLFQQVMAGPSQITPWGFSCS